MVKVALACIMHDPRGNNRAIIPKNFPFLSQIYEEIYVVATKTTDAATIEMLRSSGVYFEFQEGGGVGYEFISDARRQVLKSSLQGGFGHTHFVEMDRLMKWVESYQEELKSTARLIPEHDFLIIGRTQRAFETHTNCQKETERLANKVVALLMGKEMDFLCASRGISKRAAKVILEHSRCDYVGTDSEWPIIIQCLTDYPIGYVEVEGMEFEADKRHPDRVAAAGGVEAFKALRDGNPENWLHRMKLAERISNTAITTYRTLCAERPSGKMKGK